MYIYVDGVVDASSTSARGPMETSSIETAIGRRITSGAPSARAYWDGEIADLRLYDRALTSNEVLASFAQPFDLYSPAIGTQERYYQRTAPAQIIIPSVSQTNKITLTRTLFT
jgi:hypothetical protein